MHRARLVLVRLASAAGLVSVAIYYLLASIPFSYYHFLQFPHFVWMPAFIRFHPLVVLGVVALLHTSLRDVSPSLKPWRRYGSTAGVTAAACMAAVAFAPSLLSYELAAALAFVPLVLLAWASGLDRVARDFQPPAGGEGRASEWGIAAALAGSLCAVAYGARAWTLGAAEHVRLAEMALGGAVSLLAHVAVFALAAGSLLAVRGASRHWRWRPRTEWLLVTAAISAALALVIRRSLLTALVMSDIRAASLATTFALAVVLCGQSLVVPVRQVGRARWFLVVGCVLAVIACVVVLPRALLLADWGSTLQKSLALGTWAACVALAAGLSLERGHRRMLAGGLCAMFAGISAVAVVAARGHTSGSADVPRPFDVSLAVDRYATFDTSLNVLLDLFRPMVSDGEFFSVLRRLGDATDNRSLAPVPLRIVVSGQEAPAAYRPHIFIIVVDSLRPDYLSPYNPEVTFTPAIAAFANESIVMRRAFTPYAGTALSQPAIWAGGLIQRAMYVKPFAAVNNLERLLGMNEYRRYLSVDEILSVILEDWRDVVRLDSHLVHPERKDQMFKFDVCATIDELKTQLDGDAFEKPVFFYSQPQSLHIRVLAGDEYPASLDERSEPTAFFPPAVRALRRIDTCLGGLIDYLKQRGVYNDSVVVLTSDHGDSYGEGGRWGHAFYVAPEILRIPLIIHVPKAIEEMRHWNVDELALLTDVTPTLYDILGYPAPQPNGLLGRSLLQPRVGSSPLERPVALVQGSYSRIYGLVDGKGQWMYTADANRNREALFDMRNGGVAEAPLRPADRVQYRTWVLERIQELDRFYTGTK